jgi:hypothetical protein
MSSSEALRIQYAAPVDPWEMLDTPWGHIPAWKAATIATGTMGSAMEAYEQVRNDSAGIVARHDARERELSARADALDQRERAIGVMAAQIADMAGWDALQKAKADQDPEDLPLPPGHISEEPDPSLGQDDTGELPGQEPGEDSAQKDQDPRGEFLRLKHPVTRDQSEFPTGEHPLPPVVTQPVAAGLDDGD